MIYEQPLKCVPNLTPSGPPPPHVSQYEYFCDSPHLPPPCIMRYMNEKIKNFVMQNLAFYLPYMLLSAYIVTVNTIAYQLHLADKLCSMQVL